MELAQTMSTRRVAAKAAELDGILERRDLLADHARRRAQLLKREADVQREIEHKAYVTKVTHARSILTNGGTSSAPTLARSSSRPTAQLEPIAGNSAVQEAMRETARDCIRREELARLRALAKRESLLVERLAEENEVARVENERMLEALEQQEEEAMEARREMLASRQAVREASAEESAATAASFKKMRDERRKALDETVRQRREAKEAKKVADAMAAEQKAEELAAFFRRRRDAKEKEKERVQAQAAAEATRRLDLVCVEAETALARAQQDVDKLELRTARGKQVDAAERERVQTKLAKAVAFKAAATRNLEAKQAVVLGNGLGKGMDVVALGKGKDA